MFKQISIGLKLYEYEQKIPNHIFECLTRNFNVALEYKCEYLITVAFDALSFRYGIYTLLISSDDIKKTLVCKC